jgi:hypothetical protein
VREGATRQQTSSKQAPGRQAASREQEAKSRKQEAGTQDATASQRVDDERGGVREGLRSLCVELRQAGRKARRGWQAGREVEGWSDLGPGGVSREMAAGLRAG